ncbi:sensor histidine kinase [Amycolatopsis minnesotensis]|uniref:sensor histidine kinase n=1 Tax=Amycolatopsis minnesotensis TaxID=337894 RepID=UPI0031D974E8
MTTPPAAKTATRSSSWRFSRWVHLVYLLIPLFQPVFDPSAGAADWVIAGIIMAGGGALTVIGGLRPEIARWGSWVPLAVFMVCTVWLNSGASVLIVYAAVIAARTESRRVAFRLFVAFTLLLFVTIPVMPVEWPWRLWSVLPSLLFTWVIGLAAVEEAERERTATELRLRNARIEHLATVTERERIARDLHDLLGHSLTAVVMRAQLIAADPARAVEEAGEIEKTARDALAEVRTALTGWRQASLDRELESAKAALDSLGVELVVRRDPGLVLVGSTEHELALALREAVTNVVRHAKARTCHIGIHREHGEVRLVIADDGVGGKFREGTGLTGMRERVTALGGRIERMTAAGTTVTIAVPLEVAM